MDAPTGAAPWGQSENVAYAAVLALSALDAAGYSLIAPTLPAIARETGAGPALVGALVACFPAAMIVAFALAARAVTAGKNTRALQISLALIVIGCLASSSATAFCSMRCRGP